MEIFTRKKNRWVLSVRWDLKNSGSTILKKKWKLISLKSFLLSRSDFLWNSTQPWNINIKQFKFSWHQIIVFSSPFKAQMLNKLNKVWSKITSRSCLEVAGINFMINKCLYYCHYSIFIQLDITSDFRKLGTGWSRIIFSLVREYFSPHRPTAKILIFRIYYFLRVPQQKRLNVN